MEDDSRNSSKEVDSTQVFKLLLGFARATFERFDGLGTQIETLRQENAEYKKLLLDELNTPPKRAKALFDAHELEFKKQVTTLYLKEFPFVWVSNKDIHESCFAIALKICPSEPKEILACLEKEVFSWLSSLRDNSLSGSEGKRSLNTEFSKLVNPEKQREDFQQANFESDIKDKKMDPLIVSHVAQYIRGYLASPQAIPADLEELVKGSLNTWRELLVANLLGLELRKVAKEAGKPGVEMDQRKGKRRSPPEESAASSSSSGKKSKFDLEAFSQLVD